ncbi:SLC13 family permease [Roseibium marinum]|nr:DASS family sodium-coupled anion symporter [Roseibium marinum]
MSEENPGGTVVKGYSLAGMLIGPAAALAMLVLPVPAGLTFQGWATAAIAVWMGIWWATEALPVAVTALLPLLFFPLFDISDFGQTAAPFANPLIFLFLGGFLISLAMQRWNLHRRIALHILSVVGSSPSALIGGVMAATAFLSMWISNTATAMMMMPLAVSLTSVLTDAGQREKSGISSALLLAVAYSASIGGLATLVGSPPNALLAAYMEQRHGIHVGFMDWMVIALPVVLAMLPITWFLLTRVDFHLEDTSSQAGSEVIRQELDKMGPVSAAEKRVAAVFALVAALWIFNPLTADLTGLSGLHDAGIAVSGALLLFLIPSGTHARVFLLDWNWAKRAPWDILILFGGGLSLAQAVDKTGLASWIGNGLSFFETWPVFALVLAVSLLVIFLTELTSNTATTAAFLPVVGAVAMQAGLDPLFLAAPAAMAASCAFMLPVATPPNAIVFGTGQVSIPQMMRAGFLVNLAAVAVIALVSTMTAGSG